MRGYIVGHQSGNKSQLGASWSESTVLPRYMAFLFCQKRGCRLDIKVCLYHKCRHLKEKGGIFACFYRSKADKALSCRTTSNPVSTVSTHKTLIGFGLGAGDGW